MYDLLVKDARLVRSDCAVACSIAVSDGRVSALLDSTTAAEATEVVDAGGRFVLPGLIDTHVHFGNAGNPFEQDCRTESRAAVTGGVTTMLVYIFASRLVGPEPTELPPYDDVLPDYKHAVETESLVDVKFHLGIVHPKYVADIPRYAEQYGVNSFKAFMTNKHPAEGPGERLSRGLNDGELQEFFREVSRVPGGMALVHCENSELINWEDRRIRATGRQDIAAWCERSDPIGELDAVRHALMLAQAAQSRNFMVVHLGIGNGSEFLREKQWGTVHVTAETCPHYLLFDKDSSLGVKAKVNPTLRPRTEVDAVWDRLLDGTFDVIGSDQLTFTTTTKGQDLWKAPPGMTGGMPMILPVLLTEGLHSGRLPITRVAALTSTQPAQAFGLYPRKGALEVGSDADMVIIDEDREVEITPAILNTFSDYTPYDGYRTHGWAATTIVGGRVAYTDGEVVGNPGGRVLTTI